MSTKQEQRKPDSVHFDLATENRTHFEVVLGVVTALEYYLVDPCQEGGGMVRREIDKEARLAASVTFLKACNRLDAMLDADSRWDERVSARMRHEILLLYKKQQSIADAEEALIRKQDLLTDEALRPSYKYRPTLTLMEDGQTYIASYGEAANDACYGTGSTPEEAFKAFDRAFTQGPGSTK